MAIDYNGTDEYHLTSTTPLTVAPLTLAAWYLPDNASATYCLLSVGNSGSSVDYFNVITTATGVINAVTRASAGFGTAASTSGWSSGWAHACAVFASSASRAAYFNGGAKGTNAADLTPVGLDRIGLAVRSHSLLNALFPGLLAEAGIWNVALTDDEVAALAKGFSPLCIRPQALVFYAPLVRNVQDVRGGLTLTPTGSPTVAAHTRMIYPQKRVFVPRTPPPPPSVPSVHLSWLRGEALV